MTSSEMGKKGWQAMYKKHGKEFLSANGKKGMKKRWGKKILTIESHSKDVLDK